MNRMHWLQAGLFIFTVSALLAGPGFGNTILTQSFENPENTDWSLSLGVNSTGGQITDGTAADGLSHLQFVLGLNTMTDRSSGAVFGQFVWNRASLSVIESTLQVRGTLSAYIFYQVVPDPSDLSNQFFVIGGSAQAPLSGTEWTTWSAGQDDPFHVARFLGTTYQLPPATVNSPMVLSDLVNEPLRLQSDGTDTGRTWGQAMVRWVTPAAGESGDPGYDPPRTAELDLLIVNVPEPSAFVLVGLGALGLMKRRRRAG